MYDMKNLLAILFSLFFFVAKAQFPSQSIPTQFSTGWFRQGWSQADSGTILASREPNFIPRFTGTAILYPQAGVDTSIYYWNGSRWLKVITSIPLSTTEWGAITGTLSNQVDLQNALNLKLNSSDTANKWINSIRRRPGTDTVEMFKNGSWQFAYKDSVASGGGSGTVASVGLSMPSAFSVSGSPITTSGTFNVSGAGTTAQYIRGNGTLATTDTTMIPNFHLKARGLLSGTSPISYNSTSGVIGISNANTSGTKGAATFANIDFSDNGSGLISLQSIVSAGACTNCNLTVDAKGRIAAYSNGSGGGATALNNIGSGLRWVATVGGNIKTVYPSNTILWDSTSNSNGLTAGVDTSEIATQYDLTQIAGGLDVAANIFEDTAFVPLIILSGESNAAGVGSNSFADPSELDPDPKVQIMQPDGSFAALDIGSGNNLSGVGTHGAELQLQNLIPTVFNNRTVYLVKAGVGGSSISQWAYGSGNYDTLVTRINNALNRLREMRKTPAIVWWYSQGINDAVNGTDADEWEEETLQLFQNIRRAYGYVPVIMTQLIGDRVTYPDFDAIDAKIVDMAANKNYYIYRIQTPQAPAGNLPTDSIQSGGIHWEYTGLKALANRFTTAMMDTAGYLYYNYGIKNITNDAWNINGNRGTDISKHFIGTLDTSQLIFKQNNIEAFRVTGDQRIAIGKTTASKILDVGGDILVNGITLGRGGGNEVSNTSVGVNALVNNGVGSVNVAVGGVALQQNTSGFGNIGIGYQAGNANQTGNLNVFIGFQAGIGATGGGNVLIGGQAGNVADFTNKFLISNSSISNLLYGDFSAKRLVINPGSTPTDDGIGTLQVRGKITVTSHDLAADSDSAIVINRATNEYEYAKINGGGGSGTVTSFSFTDGGGLDGTVANSTTTPALSIAPSFSGLVYSDGSAFASTTIGNLLTYSAGTLQFNNVYMQSSSSNQIWLKSRMHRLQYTVPDADFTTLSTRQEGFFVLPTPAANRSFSMFTGSGVEGQEIYIYNDNSSGTFTWSFTGNNPKKSSDGSTVTTMTNSTLYHLLGVNAPSGFLWIVVNQ